LGTTPNILTDSQGTIWKYGAKGGERFEQGGGEYGTKSLKEGSEKINGRSSGNGEQRRKTGLKKVWKEEGSTGMGKATGGGVSFCRGL